VGKRKKQRQKAFRPHRNRCQTKNSKIVIYRIIYLEAEPHHSYLFPARWFDAQRHKLRDRPTFRSVWRAIRDSMMGWRGKTPVEDHGESEKGWQIGAHTAHPFEWSSKLGNYRPPPSKSTVQPRSTPCIWDETQAHLDSRDRLLKIDCGVNDSPSVRPFDEVTVKARRQEAKGEVPTPELGLECSEYIKRVEDRQIEDRDNLPFTPPEERRRRFGPPNELKGPRRLQNLVWEDVARRNNVHPKRSPAQYAQLRSDQERYNAQYDSFWRVDRDDARRYMRHTLNVPKPGAADELVERRQWRDNSMQQTSLGKKDEDIA
jgi:hypothetical protein